MKKQKLIIGMVLIAMVIISCEVSTPCDRLLNQRYNAMDRGQRELVVETDSMIKCLCKDEFKNN